jgi:zinc protease
VSEPLKRLLVASLLAAGQALAQPGPAPSALRPASAVGAQGGGRGAQQDTTTSSFDVGGVKVILRKVTANDVVAANLYLLGGTRLVGPERAGLEWFMLAATERGTASYPKDALRQKMARLGTQIGVDPDHDWTTFALRSTVATFDSTWSIFADRLMRPTLDAGEVELIRAQLLSAVRQRRDNPDALVEYLADSITFAGHPYGVSPNGTERSIAATTVDELRKFQREQMVTSRMLLVVVGNVDRPRVERLVAATLAKLPAGAYQWSVPAAPPSQPVALVTERRALPTNYVLGYYPGPAASSPDYNALRIATAVLSGRLFAEIRSKRNLSYAVHAPFVERAFAVGGLYVTTVDPQRTLAIMKDEIRNLQDGWITERGLEQLVQQFITEYFLDNETNADQADFLATAQLYQGDWRKADLFVDALRKVTPDDVRRVARQYMHNVRFAYVGDPGKLDRGAIGGF